MDFYRDITFAAPTVALTNFPALIRIQNDRMKKRISSTYGYDVAFRQNETNLAFDLDFYDASTGSGAWWVQVPSLPSNASSTIRMVYGDSSITTNQSTPATVWADYDYVYHFNDLSDLSSAVGTYTPTPGGNVSASLSLVSNVFTGLGMCFLITSGYGSTYYSLSLGNNINTNTGTISAYASTDVIGKEDRGIGFTTGWKKYTYSITGSAFTTAAGDYTVTMTRDEANGIFCYGGSTNTSEVNFVVNQAIQDTSTATPGWMRWDAPSLGGTGYNASQPTELIFDEMRISSTVCKSAAWLLYEQNQIVNHASYTNYGYEYHSDGTPVIDFFPWIPQSIVLD